MWFQIFKFELQYRKARPATYIYFAILLLMGFFAMGTDVVQIGGGSGLVKENAPTTIATMMAIVSAFMMMITSAIMGVGVLRDFEHKTESLMFSNPISKFDYLLGRFLGSFVVVVFVFSGLLIGFMLGEFSPWGGGEDKMLPFNAWNYLQPFLYFVIPNLFFSGALFFVTGALSRKMMIVYVQWIILFVVYQVAVILSREVDNRELASLLDPFVFSTINNVTQYWTVSELNSQVIPITDVVLWNRLLWILVGLATLVIGYFSFSFNVVRSAFFKRSIKESKSTTNTAMKIPYVDAQFGVSTYVLQIFRQTKFYFKYVVKSLPFLAIMLFGLTLMTINSFFVGRVFGTYTYPTTYLMLELIQGMTIFFIIILVFYSGELIWRERDVKINLIQDSLPMPDFVNLISKFFGLMLVFVSTLLFLIFSGVLIQTLKGFYKYDLGLYFTTMFTDTFSTLILFSLLAFFIQVMVNNKFLGHALLVLFFISTLILGTLGVEHNLFQFGSAGLGTYSEMNGYGHFFTSFSWFDIYWFAFAVFLFVVSVLFAVRGSEAAMKFRWSIGKLRLTKPILTFGIASFLMFALSGCYIFYNTNVLNSYATSDAQEKLQSEYEKTLKKYELVDHPNLYDVNLKVDIFPENRDYTAEGYYMMNNLKDEPIKKIHVQLNRSDDYHHEYIRFDRGSKIIESYKQFKYYVHELEEPLLPGDSMKMEFKMVYETKGFKESGSNTGVVYNGTFFNNSDFPTIGYNEGFEIGADDTRKEYDLKPKDRVLPRDDERGLGQNFFGGLSHGINLEIILGTAKDQTAVAPGYLQRSWEEGDRKYFHYKMDKEIMPFFNIVSARYASVKDVTTIDLNDSTQQEVNLEIYYHEGHEYNLGSMMKGMKDAFSYFSNNFSPYQFRQMRILEFPRYASFAQSFANTVPFSEDIGFMVKLEEEDDVDVTYFVTAHEMAHQWWGHQLAPANVQGSAVLSETLAQYSALMVMKHEYPEEHMQEFLKEELDRYLRGRARETKREMPLALVENQNYIHYGKGANIMYALQDYIGEDSVNVALRRFINDWSGIEKNGRYPTTIDLLSYLEAVTPNSHQNILNDFFNKIVLFENKVKTASYKPLENDAYEITINLDTKKLEADSIGITTEVALNDLIDIGIYGQGKSGKQELLYLEKHRITDGESSIVLTLDQKPSRVGIDPLYKLIDRNPGDNIVPIEQGSD